MLAAIAPAAIRRVNGLRRVVPLPCVREWSSQGLQRADRAPLLVLWDSMVPRSRATASPLWSRFLSSSASGSGHGEGSDGSGKDGKEGEGGILDAAREDGALKEESGENEVVGETGKTEVSGKWPQERFGVLHSLLSVTD